MDPLDTRHNIEPDNNNLAPSSVLRSTSSRASNPAYNRLSPRTPQSTSTSNLGFDSRRNDTYPQPPQNKSKRPSFTTTFSHRRKYSATPLDSARRRFPVIPIRLALPCALVTVGILCLLVTARILTPHALLPTPSNLDINAAKAKWMPDFKAIKDSLAPNLESLTGIGPKSTTITPADRLELIQGISTLLDTLPREFPNADWCTGREDTLNELKALKECLEKKTCRKNQDQVVVGGSYHFGNSMHGHTSGEDIWARSTIETYTEMGYTIIYAYKALEMYLLHKHIGKFIPVIITEASEIQDCLGLGIPIPLDMSVVESEPIYWKIVTKQEMKKLRIKFKGVLEELPKGHELKRDGTEVDELGREVVYGWRRTDGDDGMVARSGAGGQESWDVGCMKRETFPDGIPVWKMFAFHFWDSPAHILGRPWTLSPEDYRSPHYEVTDQPFFLGYSIERQCKQTPYVPSTNRENQVFVYGKITEYLNEENFAFYNGNHTFEVLKTSLSSSVDFVQAGSSNGKALEFIVAMGNKETEEIPDKGLTNIGVQDRKGFYDAISKSKVMLGLGRPWLSPTPYDALCLGIPFINPIIDYNPADKSDRSGWNSQQGALRSVDEPYVYHVHRGDLPALERAVTLALANPIEPQILPWMSHKAMQRRHRTLVEDPWKKRAEAKLNAMKEQGEVDVLTTNLSL